MRVSDICHMNYDDAISIRSIPRGVLRAMITMVRTRESVESITNWAVTQPLGELDHAPIFVVYDFVAVLRKWSRLANTYSRTDKRSRVDHVLNLLDREAEKIIRDHDGVNGDPDYENWQEIDVVTEQVPIQRKPASAADATEVANNEQPRALEDAARRCNSGEYHKLTQNMLRLDDVIEKKVRLKELQQLPPSGPQGLLL